MITTYIPLRHEYHITIKRTFEFILPVLIRNTNPMNCEYLPLLLTPGKAVPVDLVV